MKRGERLPIPDCWADHLERYERHLVSTRREGTSIGYRLQPATAFSRAHEATAPEAVTAATVTTWLDAGGWQPAGLAKQRQGLVAFFTWLQRAGVLTRNPAAGLAVPAAPPLPPVSWRASLKAYRQWLTDEGRAPSSVIDAVGFVERFSRRDGDDGPWKVTTTDVSAWLDGGRASGWTERTAETTRHRLGAFYTWAITAGWTTVHPCEDLTRRLRRREPPKVWARTLSQYEAHLQSRSLSPATVERRMADLVRFAWASRCSPWTVAPGRTETWLTRPELGAVTAVRLRGVLTAFYEWGRDVGRVRAVPVAAVQPISTAQRTPGLWAHALEEWTVFMKGRGLGAGTISVRRAHLRALAARYPDHSPWELDLEHLSAALSNEAWKQETRKSVRASLSSFYGWGELAGRLALSPVRRLPGVRVPRALPRPITEVDLRASLARTAVEHPREHLMLLLARYAGLRAAEVASLHARDLALVERDGTWSGQMVITGKGGDQRVVPLLPDLADALGAWLGGRNVYLFPGQVRGHLSPEYVSRLLSKRLGPRWTAHTLRHRFATNAYTATNDLRATQELLGHASPSTTARYTAVADRALLAAVLAAGDDLDVQEDQRVSC